MKRFDDPGLLVFGLGLPLAQKIPGPCDLFVGVDIGQTFGLLAHLGRDGENVRLKLSQVRMVPQECQPLTYLIEFR